MLHNVFKINFQDLEINISLWSRWWWPLTGFLFFEYFWNVFFGFYDGFYYSNKCCFYWFFICKLSISQTEFIESKGLTVVLLGVKGWVYASLNSGITFNELMSFQNFISIIVSFQKDKDFSLLLFISILRHIWIFFFFCRFFVMHFSKFWLCMAFLLFLPLNKSCNLMTETNLAVTMVTTKIFSLIILSFNLSGSYREM